MPNNIISLNEELEKKAKENAELAAKTFAEQSELTEEEKAKIAQMETVEKTVVVSTDDTGRSIHTPIEEYARVIDEARQITTPDGTESGIKAVNRGDISKTVEDIKAEAKERALETFRRFSTGDDEISDDDIMSINNEALRAIQEYYNEERLDSDKTIKKLSKLPLAQLVSILPERFVSTYTTASEIKAGNFKAKERLLTTLAYLTATGPELDYLNEYVDNQHTLMEVSRQLMELEVNLSNALTSKEKLSEILSKALSISPKDTSVWSKYIADPRRVHSEFAQSVVVCQEYKDAYTEFMSKYPGDDDVSKHAREMIQEQIDESENKRQVYLNITNLDLIKNDLWPTMVEWLKGNKKMDYKRLEKEAISALDRIRRSKQNVPFPVYDPNLVNRPELLYKMYIEAYPGMMKKYNTFVDKVYKESEEASSTGVIPIRIDGIADEAVWECYSMLLLILFGRVMKRLGDRNVTKYNAIMLDGYFTIFCRIGSDTYMMSDMWNTCKDFVEYCITHYMHTSSKR